MAAPTLVIGMGGLGGKVVCLLAERIKREPVQNVKFAVLDTDVNDLTHIKESYPRINVIQTSPQGTVGRALDQNPYARERWFPLNDGLMTKTFTEGAGQVRAISRLAFDHLLMTDGVSKLQSAVNELLKLNGESMKQVMRIIIVGSIAGGTGSGLVVPVAMYLRDFLEKEKHDTGTIIRGFFLEPDVLFGRITDEDERNNLRANAYAAVRELDAFFKKNHAAKKKELKHVVFNAPESGSRRHKDYGDVLPYHFVFLMDASNMSGKNLVDAEGGYDLDAYLQHAADCIYAQALSVVSTRSNSGEDNVIRKLTETYGRSRYCGAGYSCLEYPKEAVQRYIAFTWAAQNIANQWLELDKEYERERRDNEDLKRGDSYVVGFNAQREDGSVFYETIMQASERHDEDGNPIDILGNYMDDLVNHALAWNEGTLLDQCLPLKRCLFSDIGTPLFVALPTSDVAVEEYYEDSDNHDDASLEYSDFWNRLSRYSRIAQDEIPTLARQSARRTFSVSDYEDDPLGTRDKEWLVESIFRAKRDGKEGTYHPTAVRYYLYRLSQRLQQLCDDTQSEIDKNRQLMKAAAQADYDPTTEIQEDVPSALNNIFSEGGDEGFLERIKRLGRGHKEALTGDQPQKLGTMGLMLNNYLTYVTEFRRNTVVNAFATAALEYVNELSAAYEAFFKFLDNQGLEQIRSEIKAAELNSAFNEMQGYAHRYVCANRRCLAEMRERCTMEAKSGDLPLDLCGDIYNDLLKYARRASELKREHAHRNEVSQQLFESMFQRVIVDYWTEAVMDARTGYSSIIDKSIIQAIRDEALYTSDDVFTNDADRNRYTFDYTRETLAEAYELAEPFIDPPFGEVPQTIKVCAYAENAFNAAIPNAEEIRHLLNNTYNGIQEEAGHFSRYEILFYRSVYGFCATNLPKYAPAHEGLEVLGAGQYHDAYYHLVDQLSPDLSKNTLITPHIDKNWHLLSYLPDLNEGFEAIQRHQIVRAFLHGLIFRKFKSEPRHDGNNVFHIAATSRGSNIPLWVSNGSPCDRFYELFDALEFSPPAVNALLESSRRRLAEERDQALMPSVEDCELIGAIRSQAFEQEDFEAWAEECTRATIDEIDRLMPREVARGARRRPRTKLNSARFKNLFGYGDDSAPQTSLFEIPLLYRLSLPTSELREDKVEAIIDNTFSAVREHLMNFCEDVDLYYRCCILFIEQYLIFERNLVSYELEYPSVHYNSVVNLVREKLISYLDQMPARRNWVDGLQNNIVDAWGAYRDRR